MKPYEPVLRLATPIDDGAGRRRGIVVLNVHAGRFLRGFERNPEKGGIQRMIVNSDGYWLQHRPEAHRVGLEHYLETGEGPIIDKHIDDMTGIRKNGSEFPVELTVCPIIVAGKRLFFGFLRDLSERRSEGEAEKEQASSA